MVTARGCVTVCLVSAVMSPLQEINFVAPIITANEEQHCMISLRPLACKKVNIKSDDQNKWSSESLHEGFT